MNIPEPPKFQWGQRVSAAGDLFNDGSFPGQPADAALVKAGDAGEIVQVGTHVESGTHIYLVEFRERLVVGCLEGELRPSSATRDGAVEEVIPSPVEQFTESPLILSFSPRGEGTFE
jgi:nitrogen fixation protein NifZ